MRFPVRRGSLENGTPASNSNRGPWTGRRGGAGRRPAFANWIGGAAASVGRLTRMEHPRRPTHEPQHPSAAYLFPSQRVFEATDGILNLALDLVGIALRLQLGIADRLADCLLNLAFDDLR